MTRPDLHSKLLNKYEAIVDFFKSKMASCKFPVYTSIDIRDSGFKVAPVDANVYPAGFNNICDVDRENAPDIFYEYIRKHYGQNCQNILLLTEENTKNLFYWDNISAIATMIEEAGFKCKVSFPLQGFVTSQMTSAMGRQVPIAKLFYDPEGNLKADQMQPDLIVSNNDFTKPYPFLQKASYPLNPPQEMGWHNRKKHDHFIFYNQLAIKLCDTIDLDPWVFTIETRLVKDFSWNSKESLKHLADHIDNFLADLKKAYDKRHIKASPFVFIKHNSGTYGMGVTQVTSGDDVLSWNNKMRQKMRRGKGGAKITELILQEGIPSSITDDEGLTAEPVIYLVGHQLVGGFLRTHSLKSERDNLNAPGAVFKRLCITDLKTNRYGCPLENIYGTISQLMVIAICQEAHLLKATL